MYRIVLRQVILWAGLLQLSCSAVISLATLHKAEQAVLAARVAGAASKAPTAYQGAAKRLIAANRADGYSQYDLSIAASLESLRLAQEAFELAKHPKPNTWCQWSANQEEPKSRSNETNRVERQP